MSQGPDLTGLALAQHLQAIGQVVEAQSVCRQILATRPHDVDALQLLAALLQKKAQWLQAQLVLEQLAVIRPGDGAVLAKLGEVLMTLGRPVDAVAAWRRASHLPQCL